MKCDSTCCCSNMGVFQLLLVLFVVTLLLLSAIVRVWEYLSCSCLNSWSFFLSLLSTVARIWEYSKLHLAIFGVILPASSIFCSSNRVRPAATGRIWGYYSCWFYLLLLLECWVLYAVFVCLYLCKSFLLKIELVQFLVIIFWTF